VSRRATDYLVCASLGVRDRLLLDDMKAAGGYDSNENLLRSALYNHAVHLLGAAAVDTGCFRQRVSRGTRARRSA
jgi:hypothetical protein